ncbi:MAG: DUF2924 domain-containing protein [Desulfobacterales bacterium]|nr:DUF2924 domain-containing protein [Desulfobacterales bacterium]MBF0398865.1 DUF2924 domain-containing protein [Desulfobacterales bacterium]
MKVNEKKIIQNKINMTREIEILKSMTVGQLMSKYREVFGEATNSKHKQFLIKRIAWRMQANAEGGLTERAMRRAMEIARDSDLRVRASTECLNIINEANNKNNATADLSTYRKEIFMPGMVLTRKYKDKTVIVTVCAKGFEYDGNIYRSLTAVAEAVTGTHWNGNNFFKNAIQGMEGGKK